jgi:hypothetical protein
MKISLVEFKQNLTIWPLTEGHDFHIRGLFSTMYRTPKNIKKKNEAAIFDSYKTGAGHLMFLRAFIAPCFRWLNIRQIHQRNDISF